jgi:hypothetical protein
MGEFLKFGVHGLNQFLALDRGTQKGFQNGQKTLGFIEGETAVGHTRTSILMHPGD